MPSRTGLSVKHRRRANSGQFGRPEFQPDFRPLQRKASGCPSANRKPSAKAGRTLKRGPVKRSGHGDVSAMRFAKRLALGYKTFWLMLHKIRGASVQPSPATPCPASPKWMTPS